MALYLDIDLDYFVSPVIHIDAHSDLHGHSHQDLSNLNKLGCQNYLWHSIREGLVSEIYWVLPDNLLDNSDTSILNQMFYPFQLGDSSYRDNILHDQEVIDNLIRQHSSMK